MVKTGWKKDMEKLCKESAKNWWKTGNCTKANACTASIQLEPSPNEEQVRGQ